MSDTVIIPFYPKFEDMSDHEIDVQIATYRKWLDQHGDYGRLYMMNIGRLPGDFQPKIIGLVIYKPEIATLFKLMFEI